MCFYCCLGLLVLSFFFLMIRPPLRSTLFPYTTLFRSYLPRSLTPTPKVQRVVQLDRVGKGALSYVLVSDGDAIVDRKITRLNSSHTVISYAVFCLKKKKKKKKNKKQRNI